MSLFQSLLTRIEKHCAAVEITEREFGYAAVQDGRFVDRLRADKGTVKVIKKAESYLDGHAPRASARRKAVPTQAVSP